MRFYNVLYSIKTTKNHRSNKNEQVKVMHVLDPVNVTSWAYCDAWAF